MLSFYKMRVKRWIFLACLQTDSVSVEQCGIQEPVCSWIATHHFQINTTEKQL